MANSVTIAAPAAGEYPYVEPNFLSAPRTGQVRGDLPADSTINVLTNGQFVVRDTVNGVVKLAGASSTNVWMVFNEEKLYDERKQQHKHYAMLKEKFTNGSMVPRVIKILVGDTFTTNNLAAGTYNEGDYVAVGANGQLTKKASGTSSLQVVKAYTMPDGQPGVKLECVAAL